MILSRVWYVLLGLGMAVALYVTYLAVGEYDRQVTRALKEGLASDSQTVEWALKIDARRRVDALLAGSVDASLQAALVSADSARDARIPEKAKTDAKRALVAIHDAAPADWRPDALFAIDRDGRMVAQTGYELVAGNDDFEMGGYPAVNDALHGWLRDDLWVLGSKMYVVAARPIEYDVTQRPAGALVGLKEVNGKFAQDMANRTRASVAFYAGGQRYAAGAAEGFESEKLDAVGNDLKALTDKDYHDGRTEARLLGADLGVMYARMPGDVWALGGGFAVARSDRLLGGPSGFLSNADDMDKANVSWPLLVAVVLIASALGAGLTVIEHGLPLRELASQSERFKAGATDRLHVASFRGAYRLAAQNLNEGIERAIEKAGGVTQKPADLESILGPATAQPAMSAFSFPLPEEAAPHPAPAVAAPPALALPVTAPAFVPSLSPHVASPLLLATPPPPAPFVPPAPPAPPAPAAPAPMPRPAPAASAPMPRPAPAAPAPMPRPAPPIPAAGRPPTPPALPRTTPAGGGRPAPQVPPPLPVMRASSPGEDEESTTVAAVPAELMAEAAGGLTDENSEWLVVYHDFIRIKRQCGEPTDGLTFEKFTQTLRKNRDVLVTRHGCKHVKFSVYVKEGRASLKATPMKD